MKKQLLKTVLIGFFHFVFITLLAQGNHANLQKYWHYRYRLTHYFMVVGGFDKGLSLPANNRNVHNGVTLIWQDGPVGLGYYIGVLATEYKLLNDNGQPVNNTLTELFYALKALDRIDVNAEYTYDSQYGYSSNGYILRDDVPTDFVQNHPELNDDNLPTPFNLPPSNWTNGTSIWNGNTINWYQNSQIGSGKPGRVENITSTYSQDHLACASQDNLYNVLMGLALVKKCLPDGNITFCNTINSNCNISYDFKSFTLDEADKIVKYIRSSPFQSIWPPWVLTRPDGSRVPLGGVATTFCRGVAEAGEFITGTNYNNILSAGLPAQNDWQQFQNNECARGDGSNITMPLILATIGDSWRNIHNLTVYNSTKEGIKRQGDYDYGSSCGYTWANNHYGWDLFYGAIHRILHDENSFDIDKCRMIDILDSAPWDGPYYHNSADKGTNGWACAIRFYLQPPQQDNGDAPGQYNGLDYMLFHNLYYLLIQTGPDMVVQNCPAPTGISTVWDYYIGNQYIHFNPNQLIMYGNSTIYTEPASNSYFNIPTPGSAAIIGGPQGVILSAPLTVFPGTELSVYTVDGCGLADPADYQYLPGSYHSPVINNSSTTNSQSNATASANTLPPYQMTDEFKNDVKEYSISNYPNPYKENTTITFAILEKANVSITITDMYGKELLTLINNAPYEKGSYSFNLNNAKLAAGVYYCQLHANNVIKTNKLVVAK